MILTKKSLLYLSITILALKHRDTLKVLQDHTHTPVTLLQLAYSTCLQRSLCKGSVTLQYIEDNLTDVKVLKAEVNSSLYFLFFCVNKSHATKNNMTSLPGLRQSAPADRFLLTMYLIQAVLMHCSYVQYTFKRVMHPNSYITHVIMSH